MRAGSEDWTRSPVFTPGPKSLVDQFSRLRCGCGVPNGTARQDGLWVFSRHEIRASSQSDLSVLWPALRAVWPRKRRRVRGRTGLRSHSAPQLLEPARKEAPGHFCTYLDRHIPGPPALPGCVSVTLWWSPGDARRTAPTAGDVGRDTGPVLSRVDRLQRRLGGEGPGVNLERLADLHKGADAHSAQQQNFGA